MAKPGTNATEYAETQILTSEKYWHSSSTLSSKNNRICYKKKAKEEACLYSWDYVINHDENENKNENRFT